MLKTVFLLCLGFSIVHSVSAQAPSTPANPPPPIPEAAPAAPPLFAPTPPLDIAGKHDFADAKNLNDSAAEQLKGLATLAEFQALPAADRHVYSFEVWPGEKDLLDKKQYTFNFHLGPEGVTTEKIAFTPAGGGPNSKTTFLRIKETGSERYVLKGIGNLDWSGNSTHTFKFEKPLAAFGVVLNSSGDVALRKFFWASNKDNGYPLSYTLTDGTIVQLGTREVQGALLKADTNSFLGVIDRSGREITSVTYTIKGLAGNKAQSIGISALAFATMPKPAVAPVINLTSSCEFEAPDNITGAPSPFLKGLATLDDFRFIATNKRSVYRFDTWPKTGKDLGSNPGEFSFDLKGKGQVGQKVTITATNAANNAKLVQESLKSEDATSYPALGGLGDIGKGAWAEQTFKFDKPVWGFGVTYRSPQDTQLAPVGVDGKSYPFSYTLTDGTVVNLGSAGDEASVISKDGKTFVGAIDKTDKGIVSATIRVQGTAPAIQPLYIEDLAFAFSGPPPGNWKLVMEDNFDGDKLNSKYWAPGYTFADVINNEMQGFIPEQIIVANGVCTIKVEQKDCPNMDRNGNKKGAQKFASGAFTSYDKFTATYGYFEARIKMPHSRGAGIWPAFWMLPDRGSEYPDQIRRSYRTNDYGTGVEIDLFEFQPWWKRVDGLYPIHVGCIWSYGKVTETDPAPHGYGAYALDNNGWGPGELYYSNPDTEFHTYGVYWSPERLIWYLDGKPIFRAKDPKHIPDVPHYFLFNISITGNGWGKGPDKKNPTMEQIIADMPNSMEIDYFRAYSGTLEESIPAAETDNPAIIRKYSPPPKDAPVPSPAAVPAPVPPTPAGEPSAPAAPINSTIVTPSNG